MDSDRIQSYMAATQQINVGFMAFPAVSGFRSAQLIKTVAAAGTPEAISATSLYVKTATVIGRKAARTDNTGIVHIGPSAADDSQPYDVQPGQIGAVLTNTDLSGWYIDVDTNGDGVVVIYDL